MLYFQGQFLHFKCKTILCLLVSEWSAQRWPKPRFVIAVLRVWSLGSIAHNPEVVGSNPASATTKNSHFRKKMAVFLCFLAKNMQNPFAL